MKGISSKNEMMAAKMSRSTTAPAAPQMIALPALVALQAARGHGDDDGVVAGEDQVDGEYP